MSIEKPEKNVDKMKFFKEEDFKTGENPIVEILKEHLPRQIIFITLIIVFIIFIFANLNVIADFIRRVIDILTPVIIGWVLTFIMAPLYNKLTNKFVSSKSSMVKKFSNALATLICAIVVIAIIVGLVFLFVPQLYLSITNFFNKSSSYIESIRKITNDIISNSDNEIANRILAQIEPAISNFTRNSRDFDITKFFAGVYSGVYVSFKAIINIFLAFVVMIYSLNMKEDLCNALKRMLYALVRKDIAKKILVEVRFAKNVFSNFLFGKILDSLIIGIICYICCLIMRMPYTPLIAVIIGVTNIIPFFGPFIGAIPSFLIILLENPFSWQPYGFLVFILALQQVDGNIIGPKILGDKTGVDSFWVLFSILLFGGLFGFVGMIIAVPMWAVITRLVDEFIVLRLTKKEYPLSVDEYKRLKEYNELLSESDIKE